MSNVRFFKNGHFTANPTPDHMRAVGASGSKVGPVLRDEESFDIAEDRPVLGDITSKTQQLKVKETPPLVKPTYLQDLIQSRPLVILSLPICPQCDALLTFLLGSFLEENGMSDAKSHFTKWDKEEAEVYKLRRAQLVAETGIDKFTYPQIFLNGEYCGGGKLFKMSVEEGEYVDELEKLGWTPKPLFAMDDDDDF